MDLGRGERSPLKQLILLCSTMLLFSCAAPPPEQSSSSLFPPLSSSSSSLSSFREEQDEALRNLWLRLSENNGRVIKEGSPIRAYLGEAMFETESKGRIYLQDQGLYSFSYPSEVVIEDFLSPKRLSSLEGLSYFARLAPGAFETKEGRYMLRSEKEPCVDVFLNLVDDPRPASALRSMTLELKNKDIAFSCDFLGQEEGETIERTTYSFDQIGDVHMQEIENLLRFPPKLPRRTAFDDSVSDFLGQTLQDQNALPFPNGATHQFSDQADDRGIEFSSYRTSLWGSYQKQLEKAGFEPQDNDLWIKRFRVNDKIIRGTLSHEQKEDFECFHFFLSDEMLECQGFAFINERLQNSPFPPFPSSLNVSKTGIRKEEDSLLEVEIAFSSFENAKEYFEVVYLPLLRERAFIPEPNQSQSSWRWSYEKKNKKVVIALGGTLEGPAVYSVSFQGSLDEP